MSSSDSELSDSDIELQEAFAAGKLQPGLNIPQEQKHFVNNVKAIKQKVEEFKLNLQWIETLECINKQAPLAPELAAQMLNEEQKRENQIKNNKKLQQISLSEDPVLNDFKREMIFHRQAQATVLYALPKLKEIGIPTKRPDDYFAEMAKTDEHMQKIRTSLMQKEAAQKQSEKVKHLRMLRKEGKALQIKAKQQRQDDKKQMLNQVKKIRKGISKDFSFLDGKGNNNPQVSRKSLEKRKIKDKKFGFGGKKRGMKLNTKDSAADIKDYRRSGGKQKVKNRPGKSKRIQKKSRSKR